MRVMRSSGVGLVGLRSGIAASLAQAHGNRELSARPRGPLHSVGDGATVHRMALIACAFCITMASQSPASNLLSPQPEPVWLETWGYDHTSLRGPAPFLLNFATTAVPEAARNKISLDIWNHVTGVLHRSVAWVTYRTNSPNAAYILLGVQAAADGDDDDDQPDYYTEWDDIDYDDDGQSDARSGQVRSTTPADVSRQINAWLTGVDQSLRSVRR